MTEDSSPNERVASHFIALATRTLEAEPEAKDEARGELMARLAQERRPRSDAEVESALCQLAKMVPTPWRWRGVLISGAVLLVLAVLLALQIFAVVPELKLARIGLAGGNAQRWFNQLPESDREFISAGSAKGFYFGVAQPDHEVLAALGSYRQAYPDDPAVYECYALKYIDLKNTLPPDYHETWQRIDPDNGIWNLWAAGVTTMGGAATHSPADIGTRARLLEKAVFAERLDTRMPELLVRRLAKFPKFPETYIGNAALLRLAEPVKESHTDVTLVASLISALVQLEGDVCVRTKDPARLQRLIDVWRKASSRLLLESSNYSDFHSRLYLLSMESALAAFAKSLGMVAEEKELKRLTGELDRIVPFAMDPTDPSKRFGLTGTYPPLTGSDPVSTLARNRAARSGIHDPAEAYVPGRRCEDAAIERFLSLAATILLLPALVLVWLESFRRGKRVNGIADGIAPLLCRRDLAWTIVLGCVVPLLWYWVITRFTPLSPRNVNFSSRYPYLLSGLAGLSVLLLSATLMLQSAQWRIKRQLALLGVGPRNLSIGWGVVFLAAIVLPLIGALQWVPRRMPPEYYLIGLSAACGLPLLWILWQVGAMLFSSNASALGGVLLSRKLIVPLVVACGLMIGAQVLLKSIEQHWLSLDEGTRCDLSKGGIPPVEAKKVEDFAQRLAAVLENPAVTQRKP